jgi:N-acetylneuraminic acid mutarotase
VRALLLLAIAACNGDHTPSTPPPPDGHVSQWTTGSAIPDPRLEPGVTALGQSVIVLGGFDTNVQHGLDITTRVDRFDVASQAWAGQLPDAPVAWTHIQLAGVGDEVYLLGGLEGVQYQARGEAWRLDPSSNSWVSIAPIPAGLERGASGVVSGQGNIFLIGGASSTDALASVLDYQIATDTWTQLPDLPSPRSHPAAMRMDDGTLIVVGGLATIDASQPLAEVWALPLNATAWEARTAMPTARGGCAYGYVDGGLVCAGGEAGAAALHVVERYDPVLDTWSTEDEMPESRAGMQGAVVGTSLYVPGGASSLQFEPTDSLFIYDRLRTETR